ncbi:MAG TPA: hypothetical protein P5165_09470 [Spirochaetia bacterium]|nr:hypothetical protein [Spirochaetia bacterium]
MRSRRSSLGIVLLALSALAAILAPLSFRGAPAQSIWRGYRVILVESSVPEVEVLAALEAKGIGPTVSESTQPVLVSDFSSLVRLGLAEAKARLLPGDPRLDAYILGLSAWFRASEGGKDYRVYYLKDGGSRSGEERIRKALGAVQGRVILPDSRRGTPAPLGRWAFAASAAALAGLALVKRGGSRARILLLAPLLPLAAAGSEAAVAAALAGGFLALAAEGLEGVRYELRRARGSAEACGRLSRKALSRAAGGLFGAALDGRYLALPLAGYLLLSPGLAPSVLAGLAASLLAYGAASLLQDRPGEGTGREPFRPFPILRKGPGARIAPPKADVLSLTAFGLACAALVLGAFLRFGSGNPGAFEATEGLVLPQPRAAQGSERPAPEEALALSRGRSKAELVDAADWLVHRASQEALFYLPFGTKRSDPFEPVFVPLPGGKSLPGPTFDQAWARAAYRGVEGGIEAMLLSQGGFTRAETRELSSGRPRPLAPKALLLYIILLAPPLYGALAGLPRARRAAAGSVRSHYEIP